MRKVSMTTLWAAATHPAPSHWRVSGSTNIYHILTMARGRGGPGMKAQCDSIDKMRMTLIDICSRAVSHGRPLHKTPDHPTPEPWEILLASIVSHLRGLQRVFRCCSVCETMKDYKEGYLMMWANYISPCSSIVGLYFKVLLTSY